MRILCIYPPFPRTYWGFEHALELTGHKTMLPPLGLLTVAALLPSDWEVRLCDLNVRPLEDRELDWADAVFLSGMLIQRQGLLELADRARSRGKTVIVGGPLATTSPDLVGAHADCVVLGEAEELVPTLCAALGGRAVLPPRLQAAHRPDVTLLPPPRYDLLDVTAYSSLGVQWSRGCPFNCEFCDIIEVFGHRPRTKSPEQLCRELDAIHATGFRGSLFVVDDNFVGNKAAALQVLAAIRQWMRRHRYPFQLYTEASVNLAASDELMAAMVEAGFESVFVGIETPSAAALRETHKSQNLSVDLDAAVEKLVRSGLEVMAGFIVGFDSDDATAVERQRTWVLSSPIPLAMVGMLTALPGTQLERRLMREGRLVERSGGETFGRPNFRPRMDEVTLLEGYRELLRDIYSPEAYFDRAARLLEMQRSRKTLGHLPLRQGLRCLVRSLIRQGVRGKHRGAYWRFLGRILWRAPRRFPRAIALAIMADHMVRYTGEDVLPRLDGAIEQARRERAVAARALPPELVPSAARRDTAPAVAA